MKIIYMSQGYPVAGGHEAHLLHFASEMQRRGHDVTLLVADPLPRRQHRFMRMLRERRIALVSLADSHAAVNNSMFALMVVPWFLAVLLMGKPKHPRRFREYLRRQSETGWLQQYLQRQRPAVVHVLGRLSDGLWQALPADRTVLHHGTSGLRDDTWEADEWQAFVDFAERAAINLAPGEGVIANLRRDFGLRTTIRPLFTICPDLVGADDVPLALGLPKPAEVNFGVLCRLTEEKGIAPLLEALRRFHERNGGVTFTFYGDGALAAAVRAFIQEHQLGGVTLQTEFASPAQALCGLDCFVHPSLSDAMPMAIAEALMCGLPCIVTTVGAITELVRDGIEGFVVPPGDAEAICEAMERLSRQNVTSLTALHEAARARYEACCTPERVGDALERVYGMVVVSC